MTKLQNQPVNVPFFSRRVSNAPNHCSVTIPEQISLIADTEDWGILKLFSKLPPPNLPTGNKNSGMLGQINLNWTDGWSTLSVDR